MEGELGKYVCYFVTLVLIVQEGGFLFLPLGILSAEVVYGDDDPLHERESLSEVFFCVVLVQALIALQIKTHWEENLFCWK